MRSGITSLNFDYKGAEIEKNFGFLGSFNLDLNEVPKIMEQCLIGITKFVSVQFTNWIFENCFWLNWC